jgi:4-azaleucine resistance transporter AzlC
MAEPSGERGYRHGLTSSLPLSVAVFGFGVSYGVLALSVGMGSLAPVVMSATTFAGSAQFAAASVLGAGGSATTAILAALMLNARYLPLGVTVAPWLEGGFWTRLLHAHLMVDESWAIASEGRGRWNPRVLLGAGAGIWIAWLAGTIVGVAFGDALGDPSKLGLDAAFPALFLALLAPQLRSDERTTAVAGLRIGAPPQAVAAVLGAAIALVLTPFTPAGVPIICAGAACLIGLGRREA